METVTNGNNKAIPVTNNAAPISVKTLQKAHFALALQMVDARRHMRQAQEFGDKATKDGAAAEFNAVVDAHNEVTRVLNGAMAVQS